MAEMVEAGVLEGEKPEDNILIPQGHGVEAHLALAHNHDHDAAANRIGNVVPHKLHMPATLDASASDPNVGLSGNALEPADPDAGDAADLTDPTESGSHRHHTAGIVQPGHHVKPVNDVTMTDEQEMNEGLIKSDIADSTDNILSSSEEDQHRLRSTDSKSVSTPGIFGHHAAAQTKSVGFSTALSQLFSFGIPFAGIFAVAAVVLWKRLGDLQPLTSHDSQSGV